jgi:DNA-binding transcriptional MerR regulator
MLEAKKYFSIMEVSKITGLLQHRLRYIEKTDPNLDVNKIRGRRYYTKENIDYINNIYSTTTIFNFNLEYIKRIDQLILKFIHLLNRA